MARLREVIDGYQRLKLELGGDVLFGVVAYVAAVVYMLV